MTDLDDLSFRLIFEEIGKIFTFYRDGFAAYGTFCCLKRLWNGTWNAGNFLRIYCYSKRNEMKVDKFGKWAVITGCSEGIGKAFAQELAHRGMNIYMFSKPMDGDLERVAQNIRDQFNVEVKTYPVDFSKTDIYPGIQASLAGKEVGVLVNNVGVMYTYPMLFMEVPDEKLWHLINVNIAAATMMTSIVLPIMVKRFGLDLRQRRGAIINMSGISAERPCPYMAVYSATKSYLDNFSRALNYEYSDKGIIVQSLRPFYVATRMTSFSNTLQCHSFMIPSASDYVRSSLSTLGYADTTPGYWPHVFVSWFFRKLSDANWFRLSTGLNLALRREAQRQRHRSGDSRRRHASDRNRHSSGDSSRRRLESGDLPRLSSSMTSLQGENNNSRRSSMDAAGRSPSNDSVFGRPVEDDNDGPPGVSSPSGQQPRPDNS